MYTAMQRRNRWPSRWCCTCILQALSLWGSLTVVHLNEYGLIPSPQCSLLTECASLRWTYIIALGDYSKSWEEMKFTKIVKCSRREEWKLGRIGEKLGWSLRNILLSMCRSLPSRFRLKINANRYCLGKGNVSLHLFVRIPSLQWFAFARLLCHVDSAQL